MQRLKRSFGSLSLAWKRRLLLVALPAGALLTGGYIYLHSLLYVTTDDAYVRADKLYVASEVNGRVSKVLVHEHQQVTAGALLLEIDAEPFRLALTAAEACVAQVESEIESLRAEFHQKQAELARATADIAYYERAYERNKKLAKPGFASQAALDDAYQRLNDARLAEAVAGRDLARVKAKLGDDPEKPAAMFSSYRQAEAERDQAALQLSKTKIYATMAGTVGPVAIEPGDVLTEGRALFPLVSTEYYVEANLKETDLADVRPGQPATIEVDAYPGRVWQAKVTSISPATGSEFSLLPAQNASGNWVKVVQRVAVRLELADSPMAPPLRSGLSAYVRIGVGNPSPWAVAAAKPVADASR